MWTYKVYYVDNTITLKISSDNKVREVYATTSSVSAGDTVISIVISNN